jgi:tRNA threonylcarbamoyladenosine biosynthesis protein TsaE
VSVVVQTSSVDETRQLGAALGGLLEPGVTVLLVGGLGMGKTALSQGIATGLGVRARVTSPTFTMVASYEVDGRRGIRSLLHADLYRVGSGIEADDLALGELVEEGAVALVEWGDVAPDVLGRAKLLVTMKLGSGDDERRISIDDEAGLLGEARIAAVLGGRVLT